MQANTWLGGGAGRLALGLATASVLAVLAAACSSGGGGSTTTGGGSTTPAPAASSPATSGGGSGSGTAAGAPDPCQVVTAADAAKLTGKTLKQTADAQLTQGSRHCVYVGGGTSVTVTVAHVPGATAAQAQAYYEQAVSQFSQVPGATLTHPGIGDKSLAGTLDAGGFSESAIAFLKGAVYVSILVTSKISPAALKALAVTALGRV